MSENTGAAATGEQTGAQGAAAGESTGQQTGQQAAQGSQQTANGGATDGGTGDGGQTGTATEYKFPEGMHETQRKYITQIAQGVNASQEAVDAFLKMGTDMRKAEADAMNTLFQQGIEKLQNEWGDDYEVNIDRANRVIKQFDNGGRFSKVLEATGYGNHPELIRMFTAIGTALQEEGFLKSESTVAPKGNKTPAQRMYPNQKSENF